jgi:hypothetical protein
MFVGSDDSESSDLTSYYCFDCDTRHEFGTDVLPFVCGIKHSSDEESIGKCDDNIPLSTARPAQYQVYVTFDPEARTETLVADITAHVRRNRRQDGEASDRNANTTILVSQPEWDAAQRWVQLVREKSELNRSRLAANLSKSITKLMETTNSWADGEHHVRKPRPHNNDSESNQRRPNNSGNRQDRRKRRRGLCTKQLIAPTWLPPVTLIGAMTSATNKIMIVGITTAADSGAADKTTLHGCPTCRPWSN